MICVLKTPGLEDGLTVNRVFNNSLFFISALPLVSLFLAFFIFNFKRSPFNIKFIIMANLIVLLVYNRPNS